MTHGYPKLPHTWSPTFCTTPGQMGQGHGDTDTHRPLYTATATHIPLGLIQSSLAVTQPVTHRYTTPGLRLTSLPHRPSKSQPPTVTYRLCLRYKHPPPIMPQVMHSWAHLHSHTRKLSVTPSCDTQAHTFTQHPPALHTRPCQSLTRESRPLAHLGGAGEEWGNIKAGHLLP